MAATPDLAPGARARVWILLTVTATAGVLTYVTFERAEILWITAGLLGVLLYLLLGVRLTLSYERAALQPVVETARQVLDDQHGVLVDAGGVVLHVPPRGEERLGHPAHVLTGQRLADIIPLGETSSRVAFAELLRFASAGHAWEGDLPMLDERGVRRVHHIRTLPLSNPRCRQAGLIALQLS